MTLPEVVVRQHDTLPLQRSQLSRADVRLLYSIRPKLAIEQTGAELRVGPRGLVGVVRLSQVTIRIVPRVRGVDWASLFVPLLTMSGRLPSTAGKAVRGAGAASGLAELLVATFLYETDLLIGQGLLRRYREERALLPVVRGRVRVGDIRWPSTAPRLPCAFRELSAITPENELLVAALERCAALPVSRRLRGSAMRLRGHFPEGCGQSSNTNIPTRDRLSKRYSSALELAGLILEASAIGDRPGTLASVSFVVDFDKLWEDVVAALIRAQLGVAKVRRSQHVHLRGVPGNRIRRVLMIPDVLVCDAVTREAEWVVDAKCKEPIVRGRSGRKRYRSNDIYQLATYATKLNVDGCLVYPGAEDSVDVFRLEEKRLAVVTIDVASALSRGRLDLASMMRQPSRAHSHG